MINIQKFNKNLSFIFVGDLNTNYQEWPKPVSLTDFHGVEAFDFKNLSDYTILIREPINLVIF